MPIDLDSLMYVAPCGVPGDVNALGGRAHICPDRMRIAVTECEPFEPGQDCGWCPPGETPRFLYATVTGVQACGPCVEVSGYHSVEMGDVGVINGGEYELEQWLDGPYGVCNWRACVPVGFSYRFFNDRYCENFSHEVVFRSIQIWAYIFAGERHLQIDASEHDDCSTPTFGLFRAFFPHDGNCLEWPVFTNDLVCGTIYRTVGNGSVSIRT